ncbi:MULTISPECIES: TonB-dependent receptor [Pseudoalteromonas]|uniref:TonB-dependent receptor n=1 Tax=Pseudoalteromonas amylolytica TaxID=1859457 RepID=A0A1S1MW45_9GAMM|nr:MULTISPECIES: TonB-dependent receptor [Pseudoalteromonas]OHU85377.1 TonB-dependent receptor [Pseudoalteromonas sp. JW3]OHU93002.1 TonB-dependent receptor [Pseudoalteromonas amylolytica]
MTTKLTFKFSALSLAVISSVSSISANVHAADDNLKEVEKIMVTGSRIARAEVESTSPITVVSKEALTNLGISDVSSALRRLPALTGNTANNQSSAGSNNIQTATLRGIEATNTLVLLNGRRLVGSDEDGLVDLSSIPFEAISQIEVLKDGASAIYGSDAIAGVINIITRKNFEGFKVTAHFGRSSRGDADERKVGFVTGVSTDKASIMVAASTSNNAGWEEKDRYMTKDADQTYLGGGNGRSGTAPNPKLTGFGLGEGTWTVPDASNPSQVIAWDYDKEGYNYRAAQSGANDNKTTSVFVFGEYELADELTFFTELSFHDGFVQGNQAPPGTDTGWYGDSVDTPNAFKRYPDADGNNFGVGPNQKYNPFGEAGNVSKRFSEYGSRIYQSNNTITRYTLGLQGMLADEYDWEVLFSSQSAKLVQEGGAQPSIIQIERALSDECETAADPDCVALNVFGPEGSITQDMLDFINTTAPSQTNKNDLSFIQASIAGPVMQLDAGEMMFSAGAEYREDQLSLSVDQAQRTATFDVSWGGSVTPVTSPVREISEYYLELAIPVLENLDVEAAVRYSDYSDIDQTTTNPKFGIIYRPLESVKIRGSYSTGFRAPTMAQMYQGRTSSINTNMYDPCNPNNDANYFNTSIAGCAGLNPAFSKNEIQSNDIIGGGNPNLKPEEADNMTLGLVMEPLDGLGVTLDYFDIEQSNVVFSSSRYVVDQYVAGNPEFANAVIRSNNGTGYIQTIFSSSNNIAARNLSGYDLNINYLHENNLGTWRFNLDATYMADFEVQDTSDTPFRDVVGTYDSAFGSIPEYKANLQLDWEQGNYRVTWDAAYNSKITAAEDDVMDATVFHNIQLGYFIDQLQTDVHFGVQNLFDKEPPFLKANGTSTDDNLYSFRGRFYYVGLSRSF